MKNNKKIKTDVVIFFLLMLVVLAIRIKGLLPLPIEWFQERAISIPLILISIMIRKTVQNLVADQLGDIDLKINNQKIWNPFLMIDWIGFLPFIILGVGWAKPIDSIKAISGNKKWIRFQILFSGLFATLLLSLLFRWLFHYAEVYSLTLGAYMNLFSMINMNYFLFSLLPIPPLEGWLLIKISNPAKVKLHLDQLYGYSLLLVVFMTKFNELLTSISCYLLKWF